MVDSVVMQTSTAPGCEEFSSYILHDNIPHIGNGGFWLEYAWHRCGSYLSAVAAVCEDSSVSGGTICGLPDEARAPVYEVGGSGANQKPC